MGGLIFFHNAVQEDVLREHKTLLDELRRDLNKLENFDETTLVGNKNLRKYKIRCETQKSYL